MKTKITLILLTLIIPIGIKSQVKVQIGDLYYYLKGTEASVTYNRSNDKFYNNQTYYHPSIYNNIEYNIPSFVSYNENEYSITRIEEGAFAAVYAEYLNGGSSRNYYTDRYYSYGWQEVNTIKSVSVANTIPTIGDYAFYGQHALTEVDLPGVQSIGLYAFSNCISLTTISMPNVEEIGSGAFSSCSKLVSITIPETATKFSGDIFSGCSLLREIIYLPLTPPTNWTATTITYVPDIVEYSSPTYRMNQANIIEMISFDKSSFAYSGQSPTTTWTNNVEGYTASLEMPTLKKDAGEYKEIIPVTFTKDDESFTVNVAYRYTITPAVLTFTASNASREYGEDNPSLAFSCSGFINGENESVIGSMPTVSTTATKRSNVGEYPIIVSGGRATNYTFVYEPGVLTVTKAPLAAMVNDASKVYGSQNPAFTIEYYGLKNDETSPAWTTWPSFQTDATQSSSVGNYAVRAVNGDPINYELGYITDGTLSITPAPLTIKAYNVVRRYYSENPTFSYNCSGFVNGEDETALSTPPVLTTLASLTSNVGDYEIKAGGASSPNYSISYTNGTLTIVPRPLTASVGNYDRPYNEENPAFEIVYTGFMGDDDEASLNEKPIVSTTATQTSDVGTYPIIVSGGSADNYNFSYVSGILTINKAEQTIIWDQDLSGLKVGDQVQLEAKATSGLPVTYTISDSNIGEIYSVGNTYYLDCKKEGQTRVGAIQAGNSNYYSSVRTYKNVVVISSQPVTGITLPQDNYTMLSIGETVQIDATVLPADATNKDVRWSSSNENVCTVANGVVTATGYGTAIVMASTIEGGYTASCTVKVLEKGDADGSGEINNHDAVAVAYYILGRPLNSFIFTLADVNEDGIISISDAVGIIDIIMKARK